MLSSLLQHPARYQAVLVGLTAFCLSFLSRAEVLPANTEGEWLPAVALMSNEELTESAGLLTDPEDPLDNAELAQRDMHAQWLASGLADEARYEEGGNAIRELAKGAAKTFWKSLVRKDASLNVYTPVVEGRLSSQRGEADYDLRLSGNTLKFKVEYHF